MKRFNISLIIGLIIISSCTEKLDVTPYDGLTDEQIFSTTDGFENAIMGVYSGFNTDGYYGEYSGIIICPEILSDNLTLNMESGRQTHRDLFEYSNNAIDESFGTYGQGYRIISRANRILDNIEGIDKNDFRDNIEGEALALRAIVHFDIARIYCKIPTQSADANSSLGIYYSESFTPEQKVRRVGTTVAGVYQNIIRDLEKSLLLIEEYNGEGRLNQSAIYALLSRVHLNNGNFTKANQCADSVINTGYFPVAPIDMFEYIWTDQYASNIIFRIVANSNVQAGVVYSQTANNEIRSEYVCSYDLYNLYAANDIRFYTSIITSEYDGDMYNHVSKYLGSPTGDRNVIHGKYIRMEEVLLNKAEALYNLNDEANALIALNQLRNERYLPFISPDETGTDLLDAILLERRLELAFEGDRFFTLKRLGLDLNRLSNGEFADGTGTTPVLLTYPASGYRWQLPIPQGAFDSNSDLTIDDQNPGY